MMPHAVDLAFMSPLVPVLLLGWLPIVIALFAIMPAQRAVVVSLITAWLLLPIAVFNLTFLPPYSKMTATGLGILLATAIFDSGRFFALRFRMVDVFVIAWLAMGMVSSVVAGRGPYDGASIMLHQTVGWGIPYLIGRLYLTDLSGFRELAVGIIIGSLLYAPLCLYEIRFGPILHHTLYGYSQHYFGQTRRGSFYRPMVFMEHGLAVGVFLCAGALLAFWLWLTGAMRMLMGVPMWMIAGFLGFVAVACQSWGATVLAFFGAGVLFLSRRFGVWTLVLVVVALPSAYILARAAGWSGSILVDLAGLLGPQRQLSLQTRLTSENAFLAMGGQAFLLGEGRFRWAGEVIRAADGGYQSLIPDGFWMVAIGRHGVVGLGAIMIGMLLPIVLLARAMPRRLLAHPQVAPCVGLAMILALWMCDNIFNAMINPIWIAVAGGLTNIAATRWALYHPTPPPPAEVWPPPMPPTAADERRTAFGRT